MRDARDKVPVWPHSSLVTPRQSRAAVNVQTWRAHCRTIIISAVMTQARKYCCYNVPWGFGGAAFARMSWAAKALGRKPPNPLVKISARKGYER